MIIITEAECISELNNTERELLKEGYILVYPNRYYNGFATGDIYYICNSYSHIVSVNTGRNSRFAEYYETPKVQLEIEKDYIISINCSSKLESLALGIFIRRNDLVNHTDSFAILSGEISKMVDIMRAINF